MASDSKAASTCFLTFSKELTLGRLLVQFSGETSMVGRQLGWVILEVLSNLGRWRTRLGDLGSLVQPW